MSIKKKFFSFWAFRMLWVEEQTIHLQCWAWFVSFQKRSRFQLPSSQDYTRCFKFVLWFVFLSAVIPTRLFLYPWSFLLTSYAVFPTEVCWLCLTCMNLQERHRFWSTWNIKCLNKCSWETVGNPFWMHGHQQLILETCVNSLETCNNYESMDSMYEDLDLDLVEIRTNKIDQRWPILASQPDQKPVSWV